MAISVSTSLDYLIPDLRMHLGDIDPTAYKYASDYLRHALVMACKTLMKKWRNRYVINASYVVGRNSTVVYELDPPPVIQYSDERAFTLQAAIIVKSAELQDSAWDISSWRDDEVSYSNIAGGAILRKSLLDDIDELELWLRRRLFSASRQSLPGFRNPPNYREGYD